MLLLKEMCISIRSHINDIDVLRCFTKHPETEIVVMHCEDAFDVFIARTDGHLKSSAVNINSYKSSPSLSIYV